MESLKDIKQWRSEELARLNLLKSTHNLLVEKSPTPLFDFIVTIKSIKKTFAVEVKTNLSFEKNMAQQLKVIKKYRDAGMITIPVLLIKIDEAKEIGELDFLVLPSKDTKLLVKKSFDFKALDVKTLDLFINRIITWWKN